MKARDLAARFGMSPHEENGVFVERHYDAPLGQRPASGCMYYYLGQQERSVFHVIDCDEYWTYHAGSTLEIWTIDQEGVFAVKKLGVEEGAEPIVRMAAGTVFAAKHAKGADDGTFLGCITVPRFTYEGSTLLSKEEALAKHPCLAGFWE